MSHKAKNSTLLYVAYILWIFWHPWDPWGCVHVHRFEKRCINIILTLNCCYRILVNRRKQKDCFVMEKICIKACLEIDKTQVCSMLQSPQNIYFRLTGTDSFHCGIWSAIMQVQTCCAISLLIKSLLHKPLGMLELGMAIPRNISFLGDQGK